MYPRTIIDSLPAVPNRDQLTHKDLHAHFSTGQSILLSGSGRDKKYGYRNGIQTDLGDIRNDVWRDLVRELIVRSHEEDLFDKLLEWEKEHTYWLKTKAELEHYTLELYAARIFDNPKWVDYRYKLISMRSSEKNRFQNAFTVCNVALDSVVSDMFGKSAAAITDYLTSDEDFDPQHCVSLLQRSLKKKADDVLESIEGYEITQEQKTRIGIVRDHLHYIGSLVERVDTCIDTMVNRYEGYIILLCTIPGVDRSSAITILSEIGIDMTQFGSSKRLCCWAGLTPGNNESAGKKKSVRISRAGVYLKPALVQVAHAAVKDKASPYYVLKYERIAKRRGKKRAIIAIARMILTAVYVMLSNLEEWNPVDLYKVDMPEHLKEKQLAKAVKQAVRFLEAQGLTVLDSA